MEKVSVVIPNWNSEKTIEKAVLSALNQSIPPIEVLVCDDGSTDKSEMVVKSIDDSRVKWIKGQRGGRPAIPRNRGVNNSSGDWIAFLDSDDEWLHEKLEKQLSLAEKTGCKAVCSNAFVNKPNTGITGKMLDLDRNLITLDNLLNCNEVICSSAIIHKSLVNEVEGFPEGPEFKAIEDYALWLKVLAFNNFAYVEEPLVIYRDDALNSIRGKAINNVWLQKRLVLKDFLDWARRHDIQSECLIKAKNEYSYTKKRIRNDAIKYYLKKLKIYDFD